MSILKIMVGTNIEWMMKNEIKKLCSKWIITFKKKKNNNTV